LDWVPIIVAVTALSGQILIGLMLYFWKLWLRAYGAEKAKNLARKEDLEEILLEVRAVTVTQKQIEAKLSGTEWNRQILWNKRAELYSSVMSIVCELEDSTIKLRILESQILRDPSELQLARDRRLALNLSLRKLEGPMSLFATSAACEALSVYFDESTPETLDKELAALQVLHAAVCEQAKAHLHLMESL